MKINFDNKGVNLTQAIILAGGQGVRLKPLTNDKPKPMVEVGGRPFLEYLIELLKKNGIKEIVLLLGYMPQKIVDYFGNGSKFGVKINYSISEIEDLNGTRIKKAKQLLNDHFLLLFGDMYWPFNLSKIKNFYEQKNCLPLMAVFNNSEGVGEYGNLSNLKVSSDSFVEYYGKRLVENPKIKGVDMGTYILSKKYIDLMPNSNFSLQDDFCPFLISKGELVAYVTCQRYCTITSQDFLKSAEKFLQDYHLKILEN